jgi:glycosyltransferase involved in cell wall biosynthesis
MKILYDGTVYCGQIPGGINRYFTNLISRLPKTDQPTLVTIHEMALRLPSQPNIEIISYRRFRPGRVSFALESAYFNFRLSNTKFDLAHPTYYTLLTQKETNEYRCPLVITVYDMIHERYPNLFPPDDITVEAKKRAILAAETIICISHNTKRDLLERYNISESKVVVTHLAADININQSYNSELVPAQPYFLYVGGRTGYKNFDVLLQAFSKIASVQPDISLCVTGYPFNSIEKQYISELGIDNRIVHCGFASDAQLAKLYRCSAAFVYPSLYEGFGIPPLEAMSCGGVVVASDCSSIPEVVGDAGMLFNPNAIGDLTDILLFLLDNPLERDHLITKGLERSKQFSWEKTAAQTFNIYSSIAN